MFDLYPDLPDKFYLDISKMIIPQNAPESEAAFWQTAPKILPIMKNPEFGNKNQLQFLLVENDCDPDFVTRAREYSRLRYLQQMGIEPRREFLKRPLGFNHLPVGAIIL